MLAIEAMATSFNNLILRGRGSRKMQILCNNQRGGEKSRGVASGQWPLARGEPFAIYFPLISVFICLRFPLVDNVGGK